MSATTKYRGWTIAQDDSHTSATAVKFWEHQNDDGTKFADSHAQVLAAIDDIIIERQAEQIERLTEALKDCAHRMDQSRDLLKSHNGGTWNILNTNEAKSALRYCES